MSCNSTVGCDKSSLDFCYTCGDAAANCSIYHIDSAGQGIGIACYGFVNICNTGKQAAVERAADTSDLGSVTAIDVANIDIGSIKKILRGDLFSQS